MAGPARGRVAPEQVAARRLRSRQVNRRVMLQGSSQRHRRIDRVRSWVLVSALSACAAVAAAQMHAGQGTLQQTAAPHVASVPSLTEEQQAEFAHAQAAVEKILAGAEFQRPEPTLWDRVKARI